MNFSWSVFQLVITDFYLVITIFNLVIISFSIGDHRFLNWCLPMLHLVRTDLITGRGQFDNWWRPIAAVMAETWGKDPR